MTSYSYVFAFDTSQLRGGHRLRPGGQATVIRQVFALLCRARAGPYGQLAWFWLSDVPYFFLMYVNVDVTSSLLLADFIVPADCSSWELRLRQPTALGGTDVAGRPAADVIPPYSLTLTYLPTHAFGTLAPLGQASKFLFCSA